MEKPRETKRAAKERRKIPLRLIVSNVNQPLAEDEALLIRRVSAQCGIHAEEIRSLRVQKRALDARKKREICFVYRVSIEVSDAVGKRLLLANDSRIAAETPAAAETLSRGTERLIGRVVVVGLGPAGLFAALTLAKNGYCPLVIERGEPIGKRARSVEAYWESGILDPESNVMFGEGGAGTFSDGKLTSRSKDARGDAVLNTLASFGAPQEIRIDAKPHIGTDRLRVVVSAMRKEIERLGGEVRFSTKLVGLHTNENGISDVEIAMGNGTERVSCGALILAIGQGARDTYRMLLRAGVMQGKKPFAVGVRIEHPQTRIDRAQYGAFAGNLRLGAAEYRLTGQSGDRGVYTFCMCPGGRVIASASEAGQVVVNGMSDYARNGENANAAIVVQVRAEDTEDDPHGGLRLQERMEQRAFLDGGGSGEAPASRVCDFLNRKKPQNFGGVKPSYRPGVNAADLWETLPPFVAKGVFDGIHAFARQLTGFDDGDAVLTAAETRTSAPLRILRGEDMQSVSVKGVYPVGEGAGYAGGIVSAAIDGMKAAERIIGRFFAPSKASE